VGGCVVVTFRNPVIFLSGTLFRNFKLFLNIPIMNVDIDKFKGKYRSSTARLAGYDYSKNGCYYVTICTKDKIHFFGEVIDGKVVLSGIGKAAESFWNDIPVHFPFVRLDEYIIMPNHVHGIIVIDRDVGKCHGMSPNKFSSPVAGSLSTIINHFKGAVKRWTNKQDVGFYWQTRFYEHIVRSEDSLNKIRKYIRNNPSNWEQDDEVIENITS